MNKIHARVFIIVIDTERTIFFVFIEVFQARIELPGVSGRYATALHSAASEKGITAKIEEEVKRFKDVLNSSPALKEYLASPVIPKPERLQTLDTILQRIKASDVLKNLFGKT